MHRIVPKPGAKKRWRGSLSELHSVNALNIDFGDISVKEGCFTRALCCSPSKRGQNVPQRPHFYIILMLNISQCLSSPTAGLAGESLVFTNSDSYIKSTHETPSQCIFDHFLDTCHSFIVKPVALQNSDRSFLKSPKVSRGLYITGHLIKDQRTGKVNNRCLHKKAVCGMYVGALSVSVPRLMGISGGLSDLGYRCL